MWEGWSPLALLMLLVLRADDVESSFAADALRRRFVSNDIRRQHTRMLCLERRPRIRMVLRLPPYLPSVLSSI